MNKTWNFPAGEVGVQLVDPPEQLKTPIYLTLQDATSEGIVRLMMTVDAYHQAGYHNLNLYMPYVPYGRQDRATAEGTNFGLSMFTQILGLAGFREIVIVDPHSQVTVDLLEDVCLDLVVVAQQEFLEHLPILQGPNYWKDDWVVVAPDKGAVGRAYEAVEVLGIPNVVVADKIRDPKTGEIVGMSLSGDITGKNVLVVDDICDGGRTFIELAKYLDAALTRALFVTHGIFSKGYNVVAEAYHHVYTTDTIPTDRQDQTADKIPVSNVIHISQLPRFANYARDPK